MLVCPNCAKLTGFKRALGIGTFFMVLLTCGLCAMHRYFFGGLHNEHGYYGTNIAAVVRATTIQPKRELGLTLHEFVGGLPTMLYIRLSGKIVHTVSGVIPEAVMLIYIENATSTH